jgi:cellulose synthase/poly-beta-1,6-N-acetylglucosamine synthase-like glycosyltransferase
LILLQILFWFFIALIFHTYVLFPYLLQLITRNKRQNEILFPASSEELPHVDIIFSAYNEETVIAEKIESTFASNYPIHKIHLYIGSDASNDRSDSIIDEYRKKFPSIVFIKFPKTGKVGIVNELVNKSSSPIIILTDANVFFNHDTIYQLVKHFKNKNIGLVGGNILNEKYKKEGISIQERSYQERENRIKYQEGLWDGVMIGAAGGCYSIRRENFYPVPQNFLVDDFYITMSVLKEGRKAINELNAIAYEDVSNNIKEEFRRKARISAGNFQNLAFFSDLLRPFTPLGFCFISHKVMRWLTPFFIIFVIFSNMILTGISEVYNLIFIGQLIILFIPLFDWLLKKVKINFRLFRFITHFYGMNIALLAGFIKFLTGVKSSVWQPTVRNQ